VTCSSWNSTVRSAPVPPRRDALCALFGRELKNDRFLEIFEPGARAALADLLDVIADEATGVVAAANGRTPEGWTQDVELVLLRWPIAAILTPA